MQYRSSVAYGDYVCPATWIQGTQPPGSIRIDGTNGTFNPTCLGDVYGKCREYHTLFLWE